MRNTAFTALGDNNLAGTQSRRQLGPPSRSRKTENEPNPGQIARRVKGDWWCVLPVPELRPERGTMVLGPEGTPVQNGVWSAELRLHHPGRRDLRRWRNRAALALWPRALSGVPARWPRVPASPLAGARHRPLRHDEIGMSLSDVPTALAATQNLSLFNRIPDRLQQGLLDEALPRAAR